MADHHSHGNASPSHAAHGRTKTLRPRGLNDDLQLLAGTEDGHFEDVSADVDVAVVLDEVANNKQIGIRNARDVRFWTEELSNERFHTLVKDAFWWAYAALMDHRTKHRVLIPTSMTAAMHRQMFKRISEAYVATSLRITECPHASTRDNQQRQLVDILFMAIKRMFFLKYRRSFGSMDDPLLGEVDDILSRLFSGSQPTTRRPSQGRNTVKRGPSTRHHSSGASASNGPVTPQMLAQSLNSLLVETDPARRLPAVVASFNAGDDHHSNGHTAPAGVPSPVHLPPAVRIAAEEDDARRGVGPQAHKRSSVSHRARHSDIASALRDATQHKQKPVVKRESLPARSRPTADIKKSTLLYSPLILNSLGGFDGGLSHAGRHAVCLNLTNEQNDSQKHAEAVTSTAAGFQWDHHRRHMIPAMELPALPTPAPGTAAPHTTPRLQAGTPWCADPNDHEDQPLSASTGASAFMTEPPADAPPPAARPASGGAKSVTRGRGKKAAANRAAVLQMLHQAKRQAAEEEAHEGVETVEDVLHEAKQRQHEILTTYKAARQTIKSDVARNLHENKRSLKLVEEVKSTIMAHSAGITELSNHLTAMRSFQYQADAERRERAHRGNQATRSNAPKRSRGSADADIFDPDASPMLPPDQRALDASGLPREPRKVQLAADERKNLGDNPAVLRNMGIVPGSDMSTAQPATKDLIVQLHHRGASERRRRSQPQPGGGRASPSNAAASSGSSSGSGGGRGGHGRLTTSQSVPGLHRPPRPRKLKHSGTTKRLSADNDTYTTLPNGLRVRGTIPSDLDPVAVGEALKAAAAGQMAIQAGMDGKPAGSSASGEGDSAEPPTSARSRGSHSKQKRRKGKKGGELEYVVKFPTPEGVKSRADKALARQRQLLSVQSLEVAERTPQKGQVELDVSVNDLVYIPELPAAQQATLQQHGPEANPRGVVLT